jgi:hypothetical protein
MTVILCLIAIYLIVSIMIGLLAPHQDFASLYINILASAAIIGGILGLLIYLARQLDFPLPTFLQIPEGMRDQNWRLLYMSLAAIALPLLIILTRSVLFHQ